MTKAIHRYCPVSPFKMRRYAHMIKGLKADRAKAQLDLHGSPSAEILSKVLFSAMSNAENNDSIPRDTQVVANVLIDDGPRYKRMQPSMRGRGLPILKRRCHVTVVIEAETTIEKANIEKAKRKVAKSKAIKLRLAKVVKV